MQLICTFANSFMARRILLLIILPLILGSCSEYQRVLKSTDAEYKYTKAVEYYEDGLYNRAFPLFDELLTIYRGSSRAELVYYYYAQTNFKLEDYILAAYHFKNFQKTFPSSDKAPEAAFMAGYCYYLESPVYSLDQSYTYKSINELQLFANANPESEKLYECNELIIEMREKLEKKSFQVAKLYYDTRNYQAAVVALNNTLNDYPGTSHRKEAMSLRLKAAYELAKNSIESKKLQRFIESQTAYYELVEKFPDTKESKEAIELYEKIQIQINTIKQQS